LDKSPRATIGRVLSPITIRFANKDVQTPASGVITERFGGFLSEKSQEPIIRKWALLCEGDFKQSKIGQQFAQTLCRLGNEQHVTMPEAQIISIDTRQRSQSKIQLWQSAVNHILDRQFDFVVFLIPRGDASLYSYVKHLCIVQSAVITQCVTDITLSNPRKNMMVPVAGNCLKQIMAKIGYGLWRIPVQNLFQHPTLRSPNHNIMMIGIDVCHDSRSKFNYSATQNDYQSSTVGFVASYNSDFTAYHSFVAFQKKRTERVKLAQELMRKSLELYKAKNNVYPSNIIIYRDGVGDSQLETFVRGELRDFDAAIGELKISPKPKMTVITVEKRNNVRLFEECPKFKRTGKCSNQGCNGKEQYHSPQSGTVVDTSVCNPLYSEFYLVPSIAPRGASARPTRFICVRDDININSDDLQTLTNAMCYLYFNWPG